MAQGSKLKYGCLAAYRRGPLDLLGGGYKPHHEDIAGTSKASNRCSKDPRAPVSYEVRSDSKIRSGGCI
jgi:hypothetical protein